MSGNKIIGNNGVKSMNYRPEIDGLRAISVISVLLFHAGIELFSGGFVGVDVFFVISGYLITSILIGEFYNCSFSVKSFYERRARRILPSLFFVMAVSIVFSLYSMQKNEIYAFFKSLIAASSFWVNIYFYNNIGYFDTAASEKPLLHLWSLSVEEQFYIVFPFFLMLIRHREIIQKRYTVLVLGVISLIASIVFGMFSPALAFYAAPLRGWEFLAGSYAALFIFSKKEKGEILSGNNYLGICGIILIVLSVFFLNEDMSSLNLWVAVPVFGSYLVIVYGVRGTIANSILSFSALKVIGLASYSIYLWHHPIYAFLRIIKLETPGWKDLCVAIAISISLGYASWRWVEAPFRDKRKVSSRTIFLFSLIGIISFVVIGIVGEKSAKHAKDKDFIIVGDHQIDLPKKFMGFVDGNGKNCSAAREPSQSCVFRGTESSSRNVAIIGDSHARVLNEALQASLKGTDYNLIDLTLSGCPLLPGLQVYSNHEKNSCTPEYQEARMSYLLQQRNLTVIMASRLPLYINGKGFDNTVGGVEERPPYYASKEAHATVEQRKLEISNSLHAAVQRFVDAGVRVIIVKPVPTNGWNPITRLKAIEKKKNVTIDKVEKYMSIPLSAVRSESSDSDYIIDDISRLYKNVSVVETKDMFCENVSSTCTPLNGDKIYYVDTDHLSSLGNRMIAEKIIQYLGSIH